MKQIDDKTVRAWLPARREDAHKGTYGNVLCVCGSYGMAGAALFAATAALRAGAGLATVAVPRSIYPIVASNLPEAVFLPLAETADGHIAAENLPLLTEKAGGAEAMVLGCGLGVCADTAAVVQGLLERVTCPTVLDADGLNLLAAHIDAVKTGALLCLTPHPAEAARLLHTDTASVQADRATAVTALAEKYGAVAVLKGHRTLVASAGRPPLENRTGCDGMATGGSGDVLAGMVASLAAQGADLYGAAACAVYLHGLAGERASARLSRHGMLPRDMLTELSHLFSDYE